MRVMIALLLSLAASQLRIAEVTDSGTYFADEAGRYVRLDGTDGVIVDYLYDTPEPNAQQSGVTVRANAKCSFTVRNGDQEIAVAGLPKLTWLSGDEGRTASVMADGRLLARFDYTTDGYASRISLPGSFTWKFSAPDASHRVHQSVEDATGKVISGAVVKAGSNAETLGRRGVWDAAAQEIGVNLATITYESSPTGELDTARDAQGNVVFYVVYAPSCDVAFSPSGKPLFYDLKVDPFGGVGYPDSCLITSKASEGLHGAIPDHVLLTAHGAVGLYIEDPANGAIVSAWTDAAGKLYSTTIEQQ